MSRRDLFEAVRLFIPNHKYTPELVAKTDELADLIGFPKDSNAPVNGFPSYKMGDITERVALEILSHEAIIREAYLDSKRIWTWSAGITSQSGHSVERYKDNPQTLERCLEVFVWLLKTKYGPEVSEAFKGHKLSEPEFAAAVSFHYNTGSIARASWVSSWKAGRIAEARAKFMEWRKPAEIIKRRQAECDLFFDGKWSNDGKTTTYDVAKPSYAPKWSSAKRVDVRADLKAALAN